MARRLFNPGVFSIFATDDRETGSMALLRLETERLNRKAEYGDRTDDCEYQGYPTPESVTIDDRKWCTCDGCVAYRQWWTDVQGQA